MDISNILSIAISILSIIISVIFAITGFLFTRKSDTTLSSIQKEVSVQSQQYMHLLEIYHQSDREKWSQVMDLWKVTMEKQSSPKPVGSRKVDPNSPEPIPRKSKLSEIKNKEKQ